MKEATSYAGEFGAFANEPRGGPLGKRYYTGRWARVPERRSRLAGFNWAAFFFGYCWCFWRKLYLLGILLLVVQVLGPPFFKLLVYGTSVYETGAPTFTLLELLAAFVLVQDRSTVPACVLLAWRTFLAVLFSRV